MKPNRGSLTIWGHREGCWELHVVMTNKITKEEQRRNMFDCWLRGGIVSLFRGRGEERRGRGGEGRRGGEGGRGEERRGAAEESGTGSRGETHRSRYLSPLLSSPLLFSSPLVC